MLAGFVRQSNSLLRRNVVAVNAFELQQQEQAVQFVGVEQAAEADIGDRGVLEVDLDMLVSFGFGEDLFEGLFLKLDVSVDPGSEAGVVAGCYGPAHSGLERVVRDVHLLQYGERFCVYGRRLAAGGDLDGAFDDGDQGSGGRSVDVEFCPEDLDCEWAGFDDEGAARVAGYSEDGFAGFEVDEAHPFRELCDDAGVGVQGYGGVIFQSNRAMFAEWGAERLGCLGRWKSGSQLYEERGNPMHQAGAKTGEGQNEGADEAYGQQMRAADGGGFGPQRRKLPSKLDELAYPRCDFH